MRAPACLAVLAAAAFLAPSPVARADAYNDFMAYVDNAAGFAGLASAEVSQGLEGDAADSVASALANAADAADALLDAGFRSALGKKAKKVEKAVASLRTALQRADDALGAGATRKVVLKRLLSAAKAGQKARNSYNVLPVPGALLRARGGKGACCYRPGETVVLDGGVWDADLEPLGFSIEYASITMPGVLVDGSYEDLGGGTFSVDMGTEQGAAYVTVSAGGYSSTVILFNEGAGPASLYVGTWTGTYVVDGPDGCDDVGYEGTWTADISLDARGRLTGTWDGGLFGGGGIAGALQGDYTVKWTGMSDSFHGQRVTFRATASGTSISGTWSSNVSCSGGGEYGHFWGSKQE